MKKWGLFLLCLTTGLCASDNAGIKQSSNDDNVIENEPPTKKRKLDHAPRSSSSEDIEPEVFTIDLNGPVPLSPVREEPRENQQHQEEPNVAQYKTEEADDADTETCDESVFISFEQEVKEIGKDDKGDINIKKVKGRTSKIFKDHKNKIALSVTNQAKSSFDFGLVKIRYGALKFIKIQGLFTKLETFLQINKLPVVEVVSLKLDNSFPINLFKKGVFKNMTSLKKIHIDNIFFYSTFTWVDISNFFRDSLHDAFPPSLEYLSLSFKDPVLDSEKERQLFGTDRALSKPLEAVRTFNSRVPNTFIVDGTNVWNFLDKESQTEGE